MTRECTRCHKTFPNDAALNRHSYHTHIVRSTPPSSPKRATEQQNQPSLPQPVHPPTLASTDARIRATANRPHATTPGHPNNYRRRNASCQYCGLSFSISSLQHHIQTVHFPSSIAVRTPSHHQRTPRGAAMSTSSGSSNTPPVPASSSSSTAQSATLMKRYPCEVCGQSFSTTSSRNQHVRDAHQKLQIHECPKCGTRFTRHSSLVDHMNNIHGGGNPFKCPWCDASFGKKWILTEHKTTCRRRAGASSSMSLKR
ncbi:Zinc finger C2H2 type [Gracilaria domingensis]|nr:Zinc finger C2H2 type [Gracilaria domingensis]